MQTSRWVVGFAAAIAIGSIAQAQIAPRTGTEARLVADPQIAALRTEIASLKAVNQNQEVKLLELNGKVANLQALVTTKAPIAHRHKVVGGMTDVAFCGAPMGGAIVPC
ncbi:hypothetical protein OKA06_08600 [Novosphingobium sp. MW5]|nr:hypothetical protein [Novosphingobium sp. MW5]